MICIPVKKKSVSALLKALCHAQKSADIVEIWFDELDGLKNLKKIFRIKSKPFIYKSVGKINSIKKILEYPVEFIDLDHKSSQTLINNVRKLSPKIKIILSYHDFKKTPDFKSLKKISRNLSAKKPDIIKIATYAMDFSDSLRMLDFSNYLKAKKQKIICLCMGPKGLITRIAGHLFGNYLTYASLSSKEKTAEGQITISHLTEYVAKNRNRWSA